jgi:hypothetical protein
MRKFLDFKLLVIVFASFVFVNCNSDELNEDLPNEQVIENITGASFGKYQQLNLEEALGFVNDIKLVRPSKGGGMGVRNADSDFLVGVDAGSLAFDAVEGTELKIPRLKARLKSTEVESSMFLIKVQDSTHGFLMNIVKDKDITDEDFSGIIGITDLEGKFINGYRVKNGVFISQFVVAKNQKPKDSVKETKSSLSYTTRTFLGWGWFLGTIHLDEVTVYASEEPSSSKEEDSDGLNMDIESYFDLFEFSFSGHGGGGGSSSSSGDSSDTVKVFPCDDPLHGCDDEDDEDDKITNELTGKALCVYNRLKNLKLFKETLHKFDNTDSYNLIITQKGDCNNQAGAEGCTSFDGKNTVTIKLLNINQPELDLAASILHEGIHADIFKFVNQHEKGYVDPNDRPRLMQLYFYYKKLANSKVIDSKKLNTIYQHEYMAEKYIKPIAEAIRQLDGNRLGTEYYYWFAWEGLERTYSFKSQLTEKEKKQFQQKKAHINSTTNAKCK